MKWRKYGENGHHDQVVRSSLTRGWGLMHLWLAGRKNAASRTASLPLAISCSHLTSSVTRAGDRRALMPSRWINNMEDIWNRFAEFWWHCQKCSNFIHKIPGLQMICSSVREESDGGCN
jgi:hypothetical protein